MYNLLRTA